MVFDFGIELGCGEFFVYYIVFQFGYIDIIGCKIIYCFVQCGGDVVDLEYKVGYYVQFVVMGLIIFV